MTDLPFREFKSVQRERLLGAGQFGQVWAGFADGEGPYAIKLLIQPHTDEEMARIATELQALSRAHSEHVVSLYGFCTEGPLFHIVLEFVEGESLDKKQEYIVRPLRGPRYRRDAVPERIRGLTTFLDEIGLEVLEGLERLEDLGIVHRDIKPENILISSSGEVKIADFGQAKILEEMSPVTRTGAQLGTLVYSAPEQISDPRKATSMSDLYSFSVLCREVFYRGNEFFGSLDSVVDSKRAAPPRNLHRDIQKTKVTGAHRVLGMAALLDRFVRPEAARRGAHSVREAAAMLRKEIQTFFDLQDWEEFVEANADVFTRYFPLSEAKTLILRQQPVPGVPPTGAGPKSVENE